MSDTTKRVITFVISDTDDGQVDIEMTIDPPAMPDEKLSPASSVAMRMFTAGTEKIKP